MKKIIFFHVAFICLYANAQPCDNCKKKPLVANYELDVQVAKPEGNVEALLQWRQLFWLTKFANAKIFALNKNCVRFLQPLSTSADGNAVLVVDQMKPTLPAGGNVSKYGDYLITGSVTQSGNGYNMHIELQTSCSRRRVAFADIPFQASSDPAYIQNIAEQGAAQLAPLIDKINEFANKEREGNKKTAFSNWGTESITITPKKRKLPAGEETEIEISMKDCDGFALGNRQIVFTKGSVEGFPINGTIGGTVTPATVTTDASGKAKAKFKMGDGKTAMIAAHYLFDKPTGCKDAMTGSCPINGVPVKVVIEYETDQIIDAVTPSINGKADLKSWGTFFSRTLRTVFHYYPSKKLLAERVLVRTGAFSLIEDGTSTFYESEDGFFAYAKFVSYSEQHRKDLLDGGLQLELPSRYFGRPNFKNLPTEITFTLETASSPMNLFMKFLYENEEIDVAAEDSWPNTASVSKGENGVIMKVVKITDPASVYKTEYIIQGSRDLSMPAELQKKLYKTEVINDEKWYVRILSPY